MPCLNLHFKQQQFCEGVALCTRSQNLLFWSHGRNSADSTTVRTSFPQTSPGSLKLLYLILNLSIICPTWRRSAQDSLLIAMTNYFKRNKEGQRDRRSSPTFFLCMTTTVFLGFSESLLDTFISMKNYSHHCPASLSWDHTSFLMLLGLPVVLWLLTMAFPIPESWWRLTAPLLTMVLYKAPWATHLPSDLLRASPGFQSWARHTLKPSQTYTRTQALPEGKKPQSPDNQMHYVDFLFLIQGH